MRSLRSYLQNFEFVEITFHYRLTTPRIIPIFAELLLRSELQQAGMELLDPDPFERLFNPALPDDPTALRRYQRPAPPFAFQPQIERLTAIANDQGSIICHLFGDGILLLDDLISTMKIIQPFTFANRQRDGKLHAVTATDASGKAAIIWHNEMTKCADPPRITAAWRFDNLSAASKWRLEILTPARLISHKKPLFHPEFRHILPFILRRVTAICYFYNHFEIENAQEILNLCERIEKEENHLRWHDWRSNNDEMTSELGGVCGQLLLKGELPDDLVDLLCLGSLMNIGKGAAYGAGTFQLIPEFK